jgi:hypothetical protein
VPLFTYNYPRWEFQDGERLPERPHSELIIPNTFKEPNIRLFFSHSRLHRIGTTLEIDIYFLDAKLEVRRFFTGWSSRPISSKIYRRLGFFLTPKVAWISKKNYSKLIKRQKITWFWDTEPVPQLKVGRSRKTITLPHAVTILRLQRKMKQKKLTHPFNVILTYIQTLFEKDLTYIEKTQNLLDDVTIGTNLKSIKILSLVILNFFKRTSSRKKKLFLFSILNFSDKVKIRPFKKAKVLQSKFFKNLVFRKLRYWTLVTNFVIRFEDAAYFRTLSSKRFFFRSVAASVAATCKSFTKDLPGHKTLVKIYGFHIRNITANFVCNMISLRLGQYLPISEIVPEISKDLNSNPHCLGFKILVTGRLTRKDLFFQVVEYRLIAKIHYASDHRVMRFGVVGIKVWLHTTRTRPLFYQINYSFLHNHNVEKIKRPSIKENIEDKNWDCINYDNDVKVVEIGQKDTEEDSITWQAYNSDYKKIDDRGIRVVDGGSNFLKLQKFKNGYRLSNGSELYIDSNNFDEFPLRLIDSNSLKNGKFIEFYYTSTENLEQNWVSVNWDEDKSILENGGTLLRVPQGSVPEWIKESVELRKNLTIKDLKQLKLEKLVTKK